MEKKKKQITQVEVTELAVSKGCLALLASCACALLGSSLFALVRCTLESCWGRIWREKLLTPCLCVYLSSHWNAC
jgi:hypothetical protein